MIFIFGTVIPIINNFGLGFAESYALSRGNHGAVVGLGITHIIAGFVTPIVIVSSGLAYR
jgi:hypothetical protein